MGTALSQEDSDILNLDLIKLKEITYIPEYSSHNVI